MPENVSRLIFSCGIVLACTGRINQYLRSILVDPVSINGLFQDDVSQRPVDIEADVKEMERRKRVEAIMNSKVR